MSALRIPPCTVPTFYFIGVSTTQSSIMQVFPRWMDILNLDVQIAGYDAPLGAPRETYRAIVEHIRHDPLVRGGLITAHKIDLLEACHDLFDELDSYAQLCGEVSAIARRNGGKLCGAAKDPVSSGITWETFVPAGHFARTGGEVLCLGSGGAAVAISVYLASAPDRPDRFVLVDREQSRLDHARSIHARLRTDIQFEYLLNDAAVQNDALMASLPRGSVVINATGMGKDRLGSPITNAGQFPQNGIAWELNYRGELDFLHQAERQAQQQHLHIEDGWSYFLHGWTQAIAEVFQLQLTPELFARLDEAAQALRQT
jgi:shikimate dehydrogenase